LLRIFAEQLIQGYTIPRPQTPVYPLISSVFERAVREIRDGAAVGPTLRRAAAVIDADIADNKGYPWLFAEKEKIP
jgi:multiple sugar transport system substrate-binding protein